MTVVVVVYSVTLPGLLKWSAISMSWPCVQGAREFVVPTHMVGRYYTLPQSPQQVLLLAVILSDV